MSAGWTDYPTLASKFLQGVLDPDYNFAVGVLKENGGVLVGGTVLGQITTGGKYVILDPDAEDGSEAAASVLLRDTTVGTSAVNAVILSPGAGVILAADGLTWPGGISDEDKATATAELVALGFKMATGGG